MSSHKDSTTGQTYYSNDDPGYWISGNSPGGTVRSDPATPPDVERGSMVANHYKGGPVIRPTSKTSGLHHTVMFAHGGDVINPNHGQYSKEKK
jgi:hypothetical protein